MDTPEPDSTACCWICRSSEPLDSVHDDVNALSTGYCACTGSLGVVHEACLLDYVKASSNVQCPTCNTAYGFYSIAKPGAPPRPDSWSDKCELVFQHFVVPFSLAVARFSVMFTCRYVLVPWLIGAFYAACAEHWEWPVYQHWIIGMALCVFRRGAEDMKVSFEKYFRGIEVKDEPTPPQPPNAHDFLWWALTLVQRRSIVGVSNTWQEAAKSSAYDLVVGFASTYTFARVNILIVLGSIVAAAAVLRCIRPVKVIKDKKNRWAEALAYKPFATPWDIRWWFVDFCFDITLFSVIMPYLAGLVFHFAISLVFPSVAIDFLAWQRPTQLLLHWMFGFCIVSLLIVIEFQIMVPLFAPGVDLIILRSVTLDAEQDTLELNYVHRFELDPLRSITDALRMYVLELPPLFLTTFTPLAVATALRRLDLTLLLNSLFTTVGEGEEASNLDLQQLLWPSNPLVDGVAHATADSWWNLLPISDLPYLPDSMYELIFHVALVIAVYICFTDFNVRRPLLAFMLPLARVLSPMCGLDRYLFDPARLALLREWLYESNAPIFEVDTVIDLDVVMPKLPLEQRVSRRDLWMEKGDVPCFLTARIVVFAFFFFGISFSTFTMTFGALVCIMDFSGLLTSIAAFVAMPTLLFFLCWSPTKTTYALGQALFWICVPLVLAGMWAVMTISLSWSTFADDTYDAVFQAQRRLKKLRSASPPTTDADDTAVSSQ